MPQHRFVLVACARWEEQHIQEWVEYHKSIGFDHIYLYSNDDDPVTLFRAIAPYTYGADPFVTFLHWPHIGQQIQIYLHFLETFKHQTEWFSFLDIDEFLVLKRLDNVAAFVRDYEADTDCLYFNWLIYGNSDKLRRDSSPTLTGYLRRCDRLDPHTKMICRSAAIDARAVRDGLHAGRGAFWHFLDNYQLPGVRCRDVLHGSTAGYAANFPASTEPFVRRSGFSEAAIERAYVAHFQFRSEEDFLRRWRRGGFENGPQWRSVFETGAHRAILAGNNVVYDTYLAEYWYCHAASAMRFGTQPPFGSPPHANIALNKPSSQSSVYEPDGPEPSGSRVVGAANNGVRNGTYGFHTRFQTQPWWQVDLLAPSHIAEIHIYNRRDNPGVAVRANDLDILGGLDGETWTTLAFRNSLDPFGLDGTPLVIQIPHETPHRFVRLRLRGNNYFHLDEIEIYGHSA